MTNSKCATDKTNVSTMTAAQLLADWVSGMGATGKTGLYEHVQDGYLRGKQLSLPLMTALLEWQYKGNDEALSYIAQGYLSKNHWSQHQQAVTDKLPLKGHVLTAAQYKENCLALFPKPSIDLLRTALDGVNKNSSKQDLVDVIESFRHMLYPSLSNDQQLQYETLLEKEQAAEKAMALFEGYQTKILAENLINVKCDMSEIKNLKQVIADNGFKITTAVPDMEQMLMSVNVDIKHD